MKIVQYMLGFRNRDGGVVRALIDLCNNLAQRGHEVIAQTTDDSDAPGGWDGRQGRPLLQVLEFSRIVPAMIGRKSLKQARQSFTGADVVHLHVPWDPICVQLAKLAWRVRVPYVLTVHGMLDDWTMSHKWMKKRLYLALGGRWLLNHAARAQFGAQAEMEQSSKWFNHDQSAVVPLLFDLKPFEALLGPEAARKTFPQIGSNQEAVALYVGRLHPIKRIEMLIDAVSELRRDGTRLRLVIAGAGDAEYEAELRRHVAKTGLSDQVAFVGFITGSEKLSLYQVADVVVLPSAHESFGFVTVEALACGTPVIATKAVNIWPELQSSGGAAIVEASPAAIASELKSLLYEPVDGENRCKEMGRCGRAWAFDYFQTDRVVQLYEAMYREAMTHV